MYRGLIGHCKIFEQGPAENKKWFLKVGPGKKTGPEKESFLEKDLRKSHLGPGKKFIRLVSTPICMYYTFID